MHTGFYSEIISVPIYMTKKLIGSKEFELLSFEKQLDLLQKDGVHIGKRDVGEEKVILYQLYAFYVEVYFEEYRKKVNKMIVSDKVDMLQPYLDQIKVKGIDQKK